jgi:hypothetical protein
MKKLLFILLFSFFVSGLYSQNIKKLTFEGQYGFIIPHSQDLKPISQSNPYGVNLHYQVLNTSKKSWDACNCFHYLGAQLSYHNFANPDVLGSAISLSGTFEPILWRKGRVSFNLLTGGGVSYLTEYYDEVENPENVFFSKPINFLLFVTPKFEYRFSENWSAHISFAYNHISNGGQSQPNKGMNYPMWGIGLNRYSDLQVFPNYVKKSLLENWNWYLESGFTTSVSAWSSGRKLVIALVGGTHRSVSSINALGAGIETVIDYSLEVENNRSEAIMPAPFIANHFIFGRVDFSQRMAIYTRKPDGYNDDFSFYQRYLLMYRFDGNLSLGFSLKAHGHIAEHMDFRIGWKF